MDPMIDEQRIDAALRRFLATDADALAAAAVGEFEMAARVRVRLGGARPERRLVLLVAATLLIASMAATAIAVGTGLIHLPWQSDLTLPTAAPSTVEVALPTAAPSTVVAAPPPLGWSGVAMMHSARIGQTATLLPDGRVLMAGGLGGRPFYGDHDNLTTTELFDPITRQWNGAPDLPQACSSHTATLLQNGFVLVVCADSTAVLYDARTLAVKPTGGMLAVQTHGTTTLLADGRVLMAGGWRPVGGPFGPLTPAAEIYDPTTGSWTATGPMMEARGGGTSTLLPDGRVLVVGGTGGSGPDAETLYDLPSAELFDPRTGTWSAASDMPQPRCGHSATLLPNGLVLVAGGYVCAGSRSVDPTVVLASALILDPASGSWTATASMSEARGGHSAVLLHDGMVLVAGGIGSGFDECDGQCHLPEVLKTAELFDPVTGEWSPIDAMLQVRSGATATLLLDGSVLIAGGKDSYADTWLASAELYVPGNRN